MVGGKGSSGCECLVGVGLRAKHPAKDLGGILCLSLNQFTGLWVLAKKKGDTCAWAQGDNVPLLPDIHHAGPLTGPAIKKRCKRK